MNSYIIEKLKKGLEMAKKIEGFDPSITGLGVGLKFDYVTVNDDATVTILTGNKQFLHGISITDAEYIIINNEDGYVLVETSILKITIKELWKDLEKTTTEDYKYIGVKIPIGVIVRLSAGSFKLTS